MEKCHEGLCSFEKEPCFRGIFLYVSARCPAQAQCRFPIKGGAEWRNYHEKTNPVKKISDYRHVHCTLHCTPHSAASDSKRRHPTVSHAPSRTFMRFGVRLAFGLLCGILGPVLSSLLTGMPGMAILPSMILELAAYGFLSGLLMKLIHTKSLTLNLYLSLIAAMFAGRIIAGLARALFFSAGNYSFSLWASSYFISTLPGILLQLILIPVIYLALKKARLIEA